MIGLLFSFLEDIIEVRINNQSVLFRNTSNMVSFATIDNLRLSKIGVIKEFPDLEESEDWENIARQRFKDKIKSFINENQIKDYIIQDLTKFGYKPLFMQRSGFRPIKL